MEGGKWDVCEKEPHGFSRGSGQGINELNFESIKKYREKFSAIKPNHPWNGLEMKEFLYRIGAWGKVRNTNKEGLTLAGLLMFSEERIITEVVPQYFLEYRESLG